MSDSTNSKHGIPFGWHAQSQRMVRPDQVARGQACECTCVACGSGLIELTEVQAEGGKRLKAADFLRGHRLDVGTVLT